jgi:type IV pilus biogenesis protein CpaD/CtpE
MNSGATLRRAEMEATLMFGRRHFRVEFVEMATRVVRATMWRESPNEAAWEGLCEELSRCAREHGVEMDLVVATERVGVRALPV